jgi:hypothetical protein
MRKGQGLLQKEIIHMQKEKEVRRVALNLMLKEEVRLVDQLPMPKETEQPLVEIDPTLKDIILRPWDYRHIPLGLEPSPVEPDLSLVVMEEVLGLK